MGTQEEGGVTNWRAQTSQADEQTEGDTGQLASQLADGLTGWLRRVRQSYGTNKGKATECGAQQTEHADGGEPESC